MKTGVSYFGNRMVEHFVSRDLPDIVAHHCTYVVHTFSENDLRFYKDTVGEMIRLTHQAGLKVYLDPWGVGGVFGGEAFSQFLLDNREAWQVNSKGEPVPGACLNSPEFKAMMRVWIDAAVDVGADVMFWDEPHFWQEGTPDQNIREWTCRCRVCLELFQEKYSERMPENLTTSVIEFRENVVMDFLSDLCTYAKEKGVQNAVCLSPFESESNGSTRWEKIAGIKSLDILGVTPFWSLFQKPLESFVGHYSRKVALLSERHGLVPQVWLQGFQIRVGNERDLIHAAHIAKENGIRNFAVWGFQGCGHMSSIRSDDPETVWRNIGEINWELKLGS